MARARQPREIEEAKQRLTDFLTSLEKLLASAVGQADLFGAQYFRFQAAWVEVRPTVGSAREEINRSQVGVEGLAAHGLIGAQLDLKLGFYEAASGEYHNALAIKEDVDNFWARATSRMRGVPGAGLISRMARRARRAARAAIKNPLWRALNVADALLESIATAIPPAAVALAPLGEFKKTVEAAAGSAEQDEAAANVWRTTTP